MTLDVDIGLAMAGGTARKAVANAESAAVDQRPYYGFAQSGFAVLEALRARRLAAGVTGEHPGYRETLRQLGIEIGEDGRYRMWIERGEDGLWEASMVGGGRWLT